MTQQSGRYDYKPSERNGMADQVADKARELGADALDRAEEWLKPVGLSIKEKPMTVLAVVGGLAFAASELIYGGQRTDTGALQFILFGLPGLVPAMVASWLAHKYAEPPPEPAATA